MRRWGLGNSVPCSVSQRQVWPYTWKPRALCVLSRCQVHSYLRLLCLLATLNGLLLAQVFKCLAGSHPSHLIVQTDSWIVFPNNTIQIIPHPLFSATDHIITLHFPFNDCHNFKELIYYFFLYIWYLLPLHDWVLWGRAHSLLCSLLYRLCLGQELAWRKHVGKSWMGGCSVNNKESRGLHRGAAVVQATMVRLCSEEDMSELEF